MRATGRRCGSLLAAMLVACAAVAPASADGGGDAGRDLAERFTRLPAAGQSAERKVKPAQAPDQDEEDRLIEEIDMLARARAEADARRSSEEQAAGEDRRAEAERLAAEQRRAEAEREAAEQRRAEAERQVAEQRRAEAERQAAEQRRAEAEGQAAEQRRAEAERQAAEQRRVEAERQAAEQRRAEVERQAAEQRRAEAERQAVEQRRSEAEEQATRAAMAAMEAEREAEAERLEQALRQARELRAQRIREREVAASAQAPLPPPMPTQLPAPVAEPASVPVGQSVPTLGAGPVDAVDTSEPRRWGEPRRERQLTRVAVLLVLEPGSRGIRKHNPTGDPILCGERGCYVSSGADTPAELYPMRRAFGAGRTLGERAGACSNSLGCIFRDVDLVAYPAVVQPIDMRLMRHDRRQPQELSDASDCILEEGRLACTALRGPDYTMWVVPEELARLAGPAALARAVDRGLRDELPQAYRSARH